MFARPVAVGHNRHQLLALRCDGTVEMSADNAQYLIRAGWAKLAEWTRDEAA